MLEARLGLRPLDDLSTIVERLARELDRLIRGKRSRKQGRDPFGLCRNDVSMLLITITLRVADGDLEAPAEALRALEAQDTFQHVIGYWTERRATKLTLAGDMLRHMHRTLTGMAEAVGLRMIERQLRNKTSMARTVMSALRGHQKCYEASDTLFRSSRLEECNRKTFVMELLRLQEHGLVFSREARDQHDRVRQVYALSFTGRKLCARLRIRGVART